MTVAFRIEPLGPHHNRQEFSCGVPALDGYFRTLVSQDVKRRISNCFVACGNDGEVAGFYTFAASSLLLSELPEDQKKRLPRYAALPAGLIGRLAVAKAFQGQGLGGAFILDAAARAARAEPAIFALLVDAKDEAAARFYRYLGFIAFSSRPATLFLPMAVAMAAIKAAEAK